MKAKIAIVLASIALIAASCNSQTTVTPNNNPPPPPPTSLQPTPPPPPPPAAMSGEVMINMTATGFEPATVTVKKGTKVTFVNKDTVPHWPASAPHPTHTDLPGFDALKGIATGASYSFTFTQVGTWKFHDHLIPNKFGSVIVVE